MIYIVSRKSKNGFFITGININKKFNYFPNNTSGRTPKRFYLIYFKLQ